MDLTSNTSSTVVPKSFHKLRDVNTFILDDGTNIPRARHRFEMTCFSNLCMKFINMISHSHLTLAPFVLRTFFPDAQVFLVPSGFTLVRHSSIDVTPFVDALFGLPPSGIQVANLPLVSRRPLDSRFYRRLSTAPLLKTVSITISWKSFWSFPIVHSARNIWYRLLQTKIPCRAFLHRIHLCSVPEATCLLCGQP
ncbi:hypothetical protein G6F56_004393 [Rhizopus delemar]|nr:hypothetical protein G6F56_004393 [Rhizopus delemar]